MKKLLVLVAVLLITSAAPSMAKDRSHGVMVVVGDQFVSSLVDVSGDIWVDGHGNIRATHKTDALNVISSLSALESRPAAEWKTLPAWAHGGRPLPSTEADDFPNTPGHCTTNMRKLYVAPDDGDIICPTAGSTCTVVTCNP